LEEDWHDAVSRPEAAHAFSNRFNHACTVRYRDEGQAQFRIVGSLDDEPVTIVEACSGDAHEHLSVSGRRGWTLGQHEVVEAKPVSDFKGSHGMISTLRVSGGLWLTSARVRMQSTPEGDDGGKGDG
jgi:hypothetical protein